MDAVPAQIKIITSKLDEENQSEKFKNFEKSINNLKIWTINKRVVATTM
jgi:hypothetical protein